MGGSMAKYKKKIGHIFVHGFLILTLILMSSHMSFTEEVKNSVQVLKIGYDPTLPPYQFVKEGEYQGFLLELVQKIFDDIDQPIALIPMAKETCLEKFRSNDIDAILGLRFDAELSESMSFSESLVNSTISIVMLNDDELDVRDRLGVAPLIIAVERNATEFEFVKNIKKANFNTAFNQQSVVDLMLLGRADMMVGVRHVVTYLLEEKGLTDQYYFSNSYVTPIDYYMVVEKDNTALLDRINTELRNLKLNGAYEEIYNRWIDDKSLENQRRIQQMIKIIAIIALIVFMGSIVVGWISIQLKKRVDEKTSELSLANRQLQHKIVEIKNSNELKNLIFESSPRSIAIFDKAGNVSAMNDPAMRICGLNEVPIGQAIDNLEPLSAMLRGKMTAILVDQASFACQEFMVTEKDRQKYYRYVIYPLMNERGGIITIEEITEEKLLKEQVAEKEKNRALIQIVSGIAHEIRNPLTSIKTYAALLPRKKDNEAFQNQISQVIPNEVDRMSALIENLIDYVKPKPRHLEVVKVKDVIDSCILLFLPTINSHHMVLKTDIEPSIAINVDKDQLKQVLINLILNAIDAVVEMRDSHVAEGEEMITITAKAQHEWCVIEIIDNGIGMTNEERANIFDLFFTTKAKGSGIGMSLCKQMIEDNKGYIEIDSEKYQGTTIRLYFGGVK